MIFKMFINKSQKSKYALFQIFSKLNEKNSNQDLV